MGIYDRDYMRNNRQSNASPQMSGRQALITLIVLNAICFFLIPARSALYSKLALYVGDGISPDTFFQIFSAGFLHSGFGHILFNMWGLYIFGSLIAPYMSGKKFFTLYLAGVASGNLLFLLCNLITPVPTYLVGASGAVCAVMSAAATLEPDRRFVMLFLPFMPMKTTTLVISYTVLEIIFSLNSNSHIAHLAHLGGFLGGYIVMRIFFGRNLKWDPLRKLFAFSVPGFRPGTVPPPPRRTENVSADDSRVSQRELDALLDKLSTSGINSLSEYELMRLRKARKQMRGEED